MGCRLRVPPGVLVPGVLGQPHHAAHPARTAPDGLEHLRDGGPSALGRHEYFFVRSWSTCSYSAWSATTRFKRRFSSSS